MKNFILLLCMFLSTHFVIAQKSKLEVNVSLDRTYRILNSSKNDDIYIFIINSREREQPRINFHGGINYLFPTKNHLTPMIGIAYSYMSYEYELIYSDFRWSNQVENGQYDPSIPTLQEYKEKSFDLSYYYQYIEFPLGIRYTLDQGKIIIFGEISAAPQILLMKKPSSHGTGAQYNLIFDIGMGITYTLSDQIDLMLKPSFGSQIFSISGDNPISERLYRYAIGIGISKQLN